MYRSSLIRTLIAIATIAAATGATAVMVDDFEQNNDVWNTLGFWSGVWSDSTSGGGLVPDLLNIQKVGARAAAVWYTNGYSEVAASSFYSVLNDTAPYANLSTNAWHVRFWIRRHEGTPAIDYVKLEGGNPGQEWARVHFADYAQGSSYVSSYWYEVSVPVSNFLADKSAQFSLLHVKSVTMTLKTGSSTNGTSTFYVDDIQIATNAAPPPSYPLVVTNNVVIDDFEQLNDKTNTLVLWSDLWVDTNTSVGGFIPDIGGAQKNGSLGGVLYYSNGPAEFNPCKFYTLVEDDAPYADLSLTNLHLRFWIRAKDGAPAIRHVLLEGADMTKYGRVRFADYNAGTSNLFLGWREISIPVTNFLADSAGGFSLGAVKLVAFTLEPDSSENRFSSIYMDDFRLATSAAPATPPDLVVTNLLMVDNFEQANGNTNTLGYWSDLYVGSSSSSGGLVPDQAGAQRNGSAGGVLFYSNGVPEESQCKFYSALGDGVRYVNLSRPGVHLRFWIKGHEGSPAIDKIILEADSYARFGRVSFAAFNGGDSRVPGDWVEISIPATNFLADSAGGFSLSAVGLVGFTMVSNSSIAGISSLYIDDILFATNAAPPPPPPVVVTNTLVVDSFEQNNTNINTMGFWSDVYVGSSNSFAGLVADQPGAQRNGTYGGVVFYSNGVPEESQCLFYSATANGAPYVDLTRTSIYLRFWIKGQDGTPAVDRIVLESDGGGRRGHVDFADYNGGSNRLGPDWLEISVPVSNFLQDVSGPFSLSRVSLVGLTLVSNSSQSGFSSFCLDDIKFAATPAPPPVVPFAVTNRLVVDNFEQNNKNTNTLGCWSDVYVGSTNSAGGLVPDQVGADKNGVLGGVLFYSNGVPEESQCKFYSVLNIAGAPLDVSAAGLHLRFWVKSDTGTPALDKVILEGGDASRYAQVNFADYYQPGTNALVLEWHEVSIPLADFLGDTHGPFSLARVSLLAISIPSGTSVGGFSSLFIDDILFATNAATPPTPDRMVYTAIMIDDFEQENDVTNTLGQWSGVAYDTNTTFAGFIPDFVNTHKFGRLGGVLFYSNSPAASTAPLFYSVLSETWPHADMSETSHVVSFWIRAADGAPVAGEIVLQGDSAAIFGRVSFADYNGGSAAVSAEWTRIAIPVGDFLADSGGGFMLERVRVFGLTFDPASSVGGFSSAWIDNIRAGTPDRDEDGMPDPWEDTYFGGPTNASPYGDLDEDGLPNVEEFVADTHPGDSNSVFAIDELTFNSPFTLSFLSSTGRLYDVYYSSNLVTGAWQGLQTNLWGNGGLLYVVDPAEAVLQRSYRLGVRLP